MKKALLTLAVVLVLFVGGVLLFIYSGVYNVAATDDHIGLVRWALSTTTERSIAAHAGDEALTLPTDTAALARGYAAYKSMCVMCHGAPGEERGWLGKGMLPQPPEMSHAAEEMSAEEVYWVLEHGIKFAGMPALLPTHSEEEIIEITAFVMAMEDMTAEEYQAWDAQLPGGTASPDSTQATSGDGHDHTH